MSRDLLRSLLLAAVPAAIFSGWFAAGAVAAGHQPASEAPPVERTPEAWNRLCEEAVGDDAGRAQEAAATLRAFGIRGRQEFGRVHKATIERLADRPACLCEPDSHERRVAAALDKISAQRDAASSGLYWNTEWEAALAAAERNLKPILSLRMLGRLDDDLSCANSRFFRTTLYADAGLADYLRRNFVLHWESVRPVPIITIDFGDGRKMQRTITGNSAHYVLDTHGRVIDCLPGLYSPAEFRRRLDEAKPAAELSHQLGDESRRLNELNWYHRRGMRLIDEAVVAGRKPAIRAIPPRTLPGTNVTIANGESSTSRDSLPTPLGETLVAPRLAPDPAVVWTTQAWPHGSSDKPTPKVLTTAGNPLNPIPEMARPAVWWLSNARHAMSIALTKRSVQANLLEHLLSQGRTYGYQPDPILERGLAVPATQDSPVDIANAGDLVMKPLTATLPTTESIVAPKTAVNDPPTANEPTVSKFRVERPLVRAINFEVIRSEPPADPTVNAEDLQRLAEQIRRDVRLSAGSLKLIRAKFDSTPAEPVAGSPTWRYARFDRMREALEKSIAGDTARNQYDLHRTIHAWLAENSDIDVAELNERVYAELFLMPPSDPWLGLAPADAFPALDNGGLFVMP